MPPRRNQPQPETPAIHFNLPPDIPDQPETSAHPETSVPPEPSVPPEVPIETHDPPISPITTEVPQQPRHPSVLSVLDNEPTANLAEAILLMTEELRRRETPSRKVKVKEPDTFDGSDPRKLNNFILQCNLYFRSNPAYSDDENKVNFALSYLRGTALEYFEPTILDSDEIPGWMDNWSAFVRTLRTQFGPIDPTADAEDGIDNLKMNDSHRILKYNVEFNRLAIRTGWDDSVLRHRYYTGLAERIKDIMGQQGKPATLEAMKSLAHAIDSRHWERHREKSRSGKSKSDSHDKSDHKHSHNHSHGHNHSHSHKSDDKNKGSNSGSNKSSSGNTSNSNNNKSAKPSSSSGNSASLSDKLGKDGKLTAQERQRRFDNNLCLFCGGTGHTAKNCPKSTSSAAKAKARAAQVKEKETPEQPKKG